MTDPRLTWLLDRLAEDAAAAKATDQPWYYEEEGRLEGERCYDHISTWDPARALAVVAALRQVLEEHGEISSDHSLIEESIPACSSCGTYDEYPVPWPCSTVRVIASIYRDRDGFEEGWGDE